MSDETQSLEKCLELLQAELSRRFVGQPPPISIKLLRPTAQIPAYQTAGAAGLDLHWCPPALWCFACGLDHIPDHTECPMCRCSLMPRPGLQIKPRQSVILHTGIALAIPDGYEGQVRARSSFARGSIVVQGTIDADYRGEIKVILTNAGDSAFIVREGERIAQLVIAPVARVALQQVEELPQTVRGEGGLGSTGR